MPNIRDVLRRAVADARLTREEVTQLTDAANADGKVTANEKAALQNTVERFSDAFAPAAWAELREQAQSLGIRVPARDPLKSLDGLPELADVAAGRKALSTSRNRSDPAVVILQRALQTLARKEGRPEYGLPRYGADGDLGSETTQALKAFQRAHDLTDDGVLGRNTLRALSRALAAGDTDLVGPGTVTLKNDRFGGDAQLQRVAQGQVTLSPGAGGAHVKAVQTALLDLGYALPRFGADGDFGQETIRALKAFQRDHDLRATGKLDAQTLGALDAAAPAPGTKAVLFPEYDQMFQDGVLTTTLGIGYDEAGSDLYERKRILDGLRARGFEPLAVKDLTDAELRAKGLDPATLDREATYFIKSFQHQGREVKALVKYVDRYTQGHKQHFAEGFAQDDLILYGGHARYGSGPDFDEKESTDGNFVLGVNARGHRTGELEQSYDAHMREILEDAPNDLERTRLTDDYQMMFFSGCTTKHYLDELRGIPKNKDARNLDLIGSNDVLYWNDIATNVLTVLDGVMGAKSVNDISAELYAVNDVAFTADGFGGNDWQP